MPMPNFLNPAVVQGGSSPYAQQAEAERMMGLAQAMQRQQVTPGSNGFMNILSAVLPQIAGSYMAKKGERQLDASLQAQGKMAAEARAAEKAQERQWKQEEAQSLRQQREAVAKQAGLEGRDALFFIETGKPPEAQQQTGFDKWLAAQPPELIDRVYRVKGGLEAKPGSGTTIQNIMPGENYAKPFDKELAKADVGAYTAARDRAMAAQETKNSLNAIESVLQNVPTGKPQEFYGKLSQYFGGDAGADFQAQQAFVNEQVNSILNAAKGPQTDQDAVRARNAIPSMGTDPRARAVVMDYMKKKLDGQVQYFQEMDQHVKQAGGLRDFTPTVKGFDVNTSALGRPEAAAGKHKVGDIITHGGKQYRVTGGDPNDPDVEPI